MHTIKELLNYINENIADGTLKETDEIVIEVDAYDIESVNSLMNDAHALLISHVQR
jgi:hypothetical protein